MSIESRIRYPDELKLREILISGQRMIIPVSYLFGRQSENEFTKAKRKSVLKEMEADTQFLTKNPIIACALLRGNATQLLIIDGHHRSRYAPLLGIREIPSSVYLPGQLLDAFPDNHSVGDLVEMLDRENAQAQTSFRRIPDYKQPYLLPAYKSLQALPFKRF